MAKYYLYNGIKLLALPDIDIATYPYLNIRTSLFGYFLYAAKEPSFADEIYNEAGTGIWGYFLVYPDAKCWRLEDGAWEEQDDYEGAHSTALPEWSNHDIIGDETGTVYLAASDPVPVAEWQKHDAYKPNTEWDGQTFYKVIGNKWVRLNAVVPYCGSLTLL